MNYNIDLPEEFKGISKPKFNAGYGTLTIYNRPFWDDWLFEIFILSVTLYMILIQKLPLNNPYIIWFLIMFFFYSLYCFSLDKPNIDFIKKEISIRSYNPFVNIYRKLFQMPFLVKFSDIDKIFSDWKYVSKEPYKYFTVLQTDASYKFRIAIFAKESQSLSFTDYLSKIIKHHSIHTDAVSDTTMIP